MTRHRPMLSLLLLATFWPASAGADEPLTYAGAMARAAEPEAAGQAAQALDLLEPLAPRYTQDFTLQLRLGWLSLSSARYTRAEAYYRAAVALSPDSVDARHGLGWALARQGLCQEARTLLQAVLAARPEDPTARAGLALCPLRKLVILRPSASLSAHIYQDHYLYSHAIGATVSLPVTLWEHLLLAPTYRYQRFGVESSLGALGVLQDDFDQHELWMVAGAVFPSFGITAHYAWVHLSDDSVDDGHVIGLSGRVSPMGDISLSATASLYSDMNVYQLSPAWRLLIPGARWLSVTVGAELQVADTGGDYSYQLDGNLAVLGAGMLHISAALPRVSLWAGARVGDLVRPTSLYLSAVNNSFDREEWSAWAGASVSIVGGLSAHLSYAATGLENRYTTDSDLATNKAYRHTVGLGLTYRWDHP